MTKIIDERWTQEIYERTRICSSITHLAYYTGKDENLLIDSNYVTGEIIAEELKSKIPDIKRIIDEELE